MAGKSFLKEGKKDFFEEVTFREPEVGKFINNWMTTLKKKNKIIIEQFSDILCKMISIEYPINLKKIEDGVFKILDDEGKVYYLKCHPYEDIAIDSFSIIKDKDENIYKFNAKGEVCLKGIMETDFVEKIVEPPKPVEVEQPVAEPAPVAAEPVVSVSAAPAPTASAAPVAAVEPVVIEKVVEKIVEKIVEVPVSSNGPITVSDEDTKRLSDLLRTQFSVKLTNLDYEILTKMFVKALESTSADQLINSL